MAATVYASAFGSGGGTSRYGDFVVVRMQNLSFITTPMELQQVSTWARGRITSGTSQRDRTVFVERFETIIGRIGSAITTRGSRGVLSRIVKGMKANALMIAEWSIPHDLDAGVEIKRKVPAAPVPVPVPLLVPKAAA